jgi:putative hydrolase
MSLLEGFSDWVMDRVGAEFIPNVTDLRRRFEERRGAPRPAFDRLVSRLTGMDLKIEQYRRGERFVAGVAAVGGPTAVARLWDGPTSLPSELEMADPAAWVRRVVGPDAAGTADAGPAPAGD